MKVTEKAVVASSSNLAMSPFPLRGPAQTTSLAPAGRAHTHFLEKSLKQILSLFCRSVISWPRNSSDRKTLATSIGPWFTVVPAVGDVSESVESRHRVSDNVTMGRELWLNNAIDNHYALVKTVQPWSKQKTPARHKTLGIPCPCTYAYSYPILR